jgi:hypothetical protein
VLHRSSAVPQTHNKTIAALCVRAGWFCSGVQLSSYPSTDMEGGNSPKGGRISPLLSGMKTVNPAVVPSPREMVRIATAPSITGRACTHAGRRTQACEAGPCMLPSARYYPPAGCRRLVDRAHAWLARAVFAKTGR